MSYWTQTQIKDQYGFVVEATPMDELRTVEPSRLVGSIFTGTTVDPNFWTVTNVGTGTTTQANNQATLGTGATANSSTILQSVRRARYVGGSANRFRASIQLGDTGTANNERRWGLFDGTDGAYFKINGTTVSICTRKTNSETAVASSSWNGNTTVPTLTNLNTYEIYITNGKVYFVINGVMMHTVSATSTTWTDTMNLPVRVDNTNSGGSTSNVTMQVRVATIYRMGQLSTNTTFFHGTTAATTVLKYGAGILHRITINNAGGTLITIYDNTSASAPVIAVINTPATANALTLDYHLSFNTGLTIVSTGTWDYTVVYE